LVKSSEGGGQEIRAKYPLADAKVEVKEIPGQPGSYNAVAWLRPWLQMEELTASLRLVAKIPKVG
jgi:type VI secretion system protein ImpC